MFVNLRPHTSAFIFCCRNPPSSVGSYRPVLAFTVGCLRSSSSVGIHRPVLAFTVPCWHSPDSVGIHLPFLAFTVQCWHSPFSVGINLPVLGFTVQCWHSPSSVGIHHSMGSSFSDRENVPNISCRYVAVFQNKMCFSVNGQSDISTVPIPTGISTPR